MTKDKQKINKSNRKKKSSDIATAISYHKGTISQRKKISNEVYTTDLWTTTSSF